MNIFPGPNVVSPEWSCPLNKGVPKEKFHCSFRSVDLQFEVVKMLVCHLHVML